MAYLFIWTQQNCEKQMRESKGKICIKGEKLRASKKAGNKMKKKHIIWLIFFNQFTACKVIKPLTCKGLLNEGNHN